MGDVIFSFDPANYREEFDKAYGNFTSKVDREFADEWVHHINSEYSTFSWIIEGMIEKAGLSILKKSRNATFAEYLCGKN